jgi:hypothetical protein
MKSPSLSVCIVTRNDDEMLLYSLESIMDIADEVIIINSSPKSPFHPQSGQHLNGLIERHTKREEESDLKQSPPFSFQERGPGGEFSLPWNNDYSALRNFAIEKATKDWILIFDPGYFFESESKEKLAACLADSKEDFYYLQFRENILTKEEQDLSVKWSVINYNRLKYGPVLPIKFKIESTPENFSDYDKLYTLPYLFRNGKGIRFSGPVYEKLIGFEDCSENNKPAGIKINVQIDSLAKKRENTAVKKEILLSLINNPRINYSEKLFYETKVLALQFVPGIAAKEKTSLREKILELNSRLKNYSGDLSSQWLENWFSSSLNFLLDELQDFQLVQHILIDCQKIIPASVNILFLQYRILRKPDLLAGNRLFECLKVLKQILNLIENETALKNGAVVPARLLDRDYINFQIARVYFELKNFSAFEHFIKRIETFYKFEEETSRLIAENNSYKKQAWEITDKFSKNIIISNIPENKKIYDRFNLVTLVNKNYLIREMYDDNIALFRYCLQDLGLEFTTSINEFRRDFTNILFLTYVSTPVNNYIKDYSTIAFQTEQLAARSTYQKISEEYLSALQSCTRIWDFSPANIGYLKSLGINQVDYLPLSFHERMQVLKPDREKSIDVLFYGGLDPRRVNVLNRLSEKRVKVTALWNLFGEKRNSFIEKAKIIINIHCEEMAMLEEHRLSFLLNNKCFIVSEKPVFPGDRFSNEGIFFSDYEKLAETCEFFLKPENAHLRPELALKGFNEFSRYKMVDFLRKTISSV